MAQARHQVVINQNGKLLKGVKEICAHLDITERDFYMFVRLGMPVRLINKRWFAWSENLIVFLKQKTIGSPLRAVDEEEIIFEV